MVAATAFQALAVAWHLHLTTARRTVTEAGVCFEVRGLGATRETSESQQERVGNRGVDAIAPLPHTHHGSQNLWVSTAKTGS